MLSRFGAAMFHPPGASLAGELAPTRRTTFLSLFISAGMVGFACSQLLFSAVYETTGGRTDYLLPPMVLVIVVASRLCRPQDSPRVGSVDLRAVWHSLGNVRRHLLVLYLIQSLMSAIHIGLLFLLPEFLEARGYPKWMIQGGATFAIIIGAVVMMVPAGHLADRWGRRRLLWVLLVGSPALYYTLVLLPPVPIGTFLVLCFLFGGVLGSTNPLAVSLAQSLTPANASMVSGLMMGGAWALGNLAPWMLGYLAKQPALGYTAQQPTHGTPNALACLGVVILGALILMVWLPAKEAEGQGS